MTKNSVLTLRITGPDGSVNEARSEQESIILGSGTGAGVRLHDPQVSNLHVMLKRESDGRVMAIDLGSERGTLLGGGRRLTDPTSLQDGDVLQVGGSRVCILFGDGASHPGPEAVLEGEAGVPARDPLLGGPALELHLPEDPNAAPRVVGPRPHGGPHRRPAASASPLAGPADAPRSPWEAPPPSASVSGKAFFEPPSAATPSSAPRARAGDAAAGSAVALAEPWRAPEAPGAPEAPPLQAIATSAGHRLRVDPIRQRFQGPLPEGSAPNGRPTVLEAALIWQDTVVDVRLFDARQVLTLGESADDAFIVPLPHGRGAGPLATRNGRESHIQLPPGVQAMLRRRDGTVEPCTRSSFTLAVEERLKVELGALTLVLRHLREGTHVRAPLFPVGDYRFFKISAVTFMGAIALGVALWLTPPVPTLDLGPPLPSERHLKLMMAPAQRVELEIAGPTGSQEEGARAAEEEGQFGDEQAQQEKAVASRPGAPVVDRNAKEADRRKVMGAGLLGALGGGAASDVLGPGGLGSGVNDALGGLERSGSMGTMRGNGGLAARGGGPGGGGEGLALGGLGTQGRGPGTGGSGGLNLGGRGKASTRIIPGSTTTVGGLDRDVVAAVIKRHANEIRFCYNKELQKDPSLGGKVAVSWTIAPSGAVSDAMVSESTLGNANVENCIVSRIRRWRFPQEKNGASTQVNFPWVFKAAGE